ncbi:MAG: hypothetical protein KAX11_04055, partial [Candidatus Aminicenantes bacterium]|nr:hypothetical protein [Candidatus Aminicenantes bacterium]
VLRPKGAHGRRQTEGSSPKSSPALKISFIILSGQQALTIPHLTSHGKPDRILNKVFLTLLIIFLTKSIRLLKYWLQGIIPEGSNESNEKKEHVQR